MKTQHIYTLLFALLVSACSTTEQTSETAPQNGQLTKEQLTAADIKTAPLRKRQLEQTIRVNGYIDVPPNQKVEVHAMLAGFVSELPVIVGDKVKKGQMIAQLISPEFIALQQSYLELKMQLKSLEQEYTRMKALFDEKISSQKDFLAAESAYLSAKTRLSGIARQLQLLGISVDQLTPENMQSSLVVRAPISGEITKVPAVMGQHLTPGEVLFQMVNTDHLHAELKVFENDLGKVRINMPVRMTISQRGGESVSGSVYQLSTVLHETGRYGMVHVHFDEEWTNPQIGAYLEADIIMESREVWAVEEEAVISDSDGTRIYTVKSGNVQDITSMAVKTGVRKDGWVELLDMPEGIHYVAKGAYYLANQ
jgi:cobalt-zinc-cadmium efflux system membrane fusion protein